MAKYDESNTVRMTSTLNHRIEAVADRADMNKNATMRALLTDAVGRFERGELTKDDLQELEDE